MKGFAGFLKVANNANKFFGNVRQSDKKMLAFSTFLSVMVFENRTPHTDILSRNKESVTQIA